MWSKVKTYWTGLRSEAQTHWTGLRSEAQTHWTELKAYFMIAKRYFMIAKRYWRFGLMIYRELSGKEALPPSKWRGR
jgi:hypothetical protein